MNTTVRGCTVRYLNCVPHYATTMLQVMIENFLFWMFIYITTPLEVIERKTLKKYNSSGTNIWKWSKSVSMKCKTWQLFQKLNSCKNLEKLFKKICCNTTFRNCFQPNCSDFGQMKEWGLLAEPLNLLESYKKQSFCSESGRKGVGSSAENGAEFSERGDGQWESLTSTGNALWPPTR